MQIIDEATLRQHMGRSVALDAVESAFRALGEDRVTQPPPMGLDIEPVGGEVHVKSAYLSGAPVFAVKIASGCSCAIVSISTPPSLDAINAFAPLARSVVIAR